MTLTLHSMDPAAGHDADPADPTAQRLLAGILEQRPPRRRLRPVLVGAAALGAGLAVFVGLSSDHGSELGSAAYAVSRDDAGTVHVDVRWSMVSDPSGLQAALDQAGARTKVFVLTDTSPLCSPSDTVPYESGAVDWHIPSSAGADDGLVLHPDRFPTGATFVLVVELAPSGTSGMSTFGPTGPSITGTLSYMTTASVASPEC